MPNDRRTDPPLQNALDALRTLMREAERRKLPEPSCASLATAGKDARPSVRIIYLSAVSDEGLVFFANMESGKGKQMAQNPRAALCFFWAAMQQQVIVDGDIEVMPDAGSDQFWANRTRESHLAAWASDQAGMAEDASKLSAKQKDLKGQFGFEQIPRPAQWKAVLLRPDRIEFWETGWHRLRPRRRYQKSANGEWQEFAENP